MKYDVVIVGAGLTGATISACLPDKRILVLEKDDVGGMCRTENFNGIEVHKYGPHIFHTSNEQVWKFVNKYAEFNGYVHRAKANIDGDIYPFPINLEVYNRMYHINTPDKAEELITENDADNFEDYLVDKIGPDLYDKYYKGYAEKFWGVPANSLPSFIAKRIPVRTSYNDLYFSDRYQGVPMHGYTNMINNMMSHCDIEQADFNSDREYYESLADIVIYTGSIDEYFDYELGVLPYRTCEYFMSIVGEKDYQGIGPMNFPDDDVKYTRAIEHKHFNWVETDSTIVSYEHPRQWKRGGNLKRFYPLPFTDNVNLHEEYAMMDHKAIFAGRLGTYSYINMDEAVRRALILFEETIKDQL